MDRLVNTDTQPQKTAASSDFRFWLDKRGGWTKRVRRIRLSGACASRTGEPITNIRARIRDRTFNGVLNTARHDLLEASGLSDAIAPVGFSIDARVPFGKSDLIIEVAGANDCWARVFSHKIRGPLIAGAADRRHWRDVQLNEAKGRYVWAVDVPHKWEVPAGPAHLSGWCVDTIGKPIEAVRARVEKRIFPATFGVPRADLVQRYPSLRATARAVFGIALRVPRRPCRLSLELKQDDGQWREFLRRQIIPTALGPTRREQPCGIDFQAGAQKRSRFEFWFDRPADWSKRRRYLHISGWCFAGEGAEVKAIRARFGRQTFAGSYGVVRPDVAARLQGLPGAFGSGFFVDITVPGGSPIPLSATRRLTSPPVAQCSETRISPARPSGNAYFRALVRISFRIRPQGVASFISNRTGSRSRRRLTRPGLAPYAPKSSVIRQRAYSSKSTLPTSPCAYNCS